MPLPRLHGSWLNCWNRSPCVPLSTDTQRTWQHPVTAIEDFWFLDDMLTSPLKHMIEHIHPKECIAYTIKADSLVPLAARSVHAYSLAGSAVLTAMSPVRVRSLAARSLLRLLVKEGLPAGQNKGMPDT